jgi:CDGSH-type Zn-finger protein
MKKEGTISDRNPETKIVISKNGPYLVGGDIPLSIQVITSNKEGFSWDWVEAKTFATGLDYALCRCGRSKN